MTLAPVAMALVRVKVTVLPATATLVTTLTTSLTVTEKLPATGMLAASKAPS